MSRPGESAREEARAAMAGASDADAWSRLAEHGFFANLVPTELGGRGEGLTPSALLFEELAATGYAPILAGFAALTAAAVAGEGSAALRERVLPRLMKGEARVSIAATEPEAGFNLFAIATRARRDGDRYRLDGEKTYVSGAARADWLLVTARTLEPEEVERRELPKTAGISVLLVPGDADGLDLAELSTRGEGRERQYRVRLDGVEVPVGHRLGDEHRGTAVLFPAFNLERVLFSVLTTGLTEFCLRRGGEHARGRTVFGETPIARYQAIQHPLADAKIRQLAVRRLAYDAADAFDGGASAREVALLANAAKYLGSQLLLAAVDAAMEAMGGRGFDEEHGVVQLWETARLLELSPISNSLILNDVAERVLGLGRSY